MIVTETTFAGFTLINGTWGIQFALLIASLFNVIIHPKPNIPQDPYITYDQWQAEMSDLHFVRLYMIPIVHGLLTIMTFVSQNEKIRWESLKMGFSFLGMVLYTIMILKVSTAMIYYHYPLSAGQDNSISMQTSFLWLIIEQLVFIAMIISNMTFLMIRSFVRHKLTLDSIDEKRQLPTVDTVMAI